MLWNWICEFVFYVYDYIYTLIILRQKGKYWIIYFIYINTHTCKCINYLHGFRFLFLLIIFVIAVKAVASMQSPLWSAVGSIPVQINYLYALQIIILSVIVTFRPLIEFIKSFSFDFGEIACIGRWNNKKKIKKITSIYYVKRSYIFKAWERSSKTILIYHRYQINVSASSQVVVQQVLT